MQEICSRCRAPKPVGEVCPRCGNEDADALRLQAERLNHGREVEDGPRRSYTVCGLCGSRSVIGGLCLDETGRGCPRSKPRKLSGPGQGARGIKTSAAEARRRRELVEKHVAEHGQVCPGDPSSPDPWRRVPHRPAGGLTADHVVPQSRGGQTGPLRVLCRGCNGARGARLGNENRRRRSR